jgi:diguanylate cyclase (GGDEF)-like protein
MIVLWFAADAPSTYRFLFREEPRYLLLRLALERRHYLRALRTAATNDHLTGLANRHHFFERVDRAPTDTCAAVLYIDLDDFKPINDTFGHAAGDEVLRIVARRLAACVRETDMVARLGGDEFALLLAAPERVDEVAERVHAAFADPLQVAERSLRVGASVGVATGGGDLLDAADRAMYAVKAQSKGAPPRSTG